MSEQGELSPADKYFEGFLTDISKINPSHQDSEGKWIPDGQEREVRNKTSILTMLPDTMDAMGFNVNPDQMDKYQRKGLEKILALHPEQRGMLGDYLTGKGSGGEKNKSPNLQNLYDKNKDLFEEQE